MKMTYDLDFFPVFHNKGQHFFFRTPKALLIFSALIILLNIFATQSKAQSFEVGIMGGFATYNGDLAANDLSYYLGQSRFAGGVFGRWNVDETFAARLSLNFGQITGDDANGLYPERGLHFRSNIIEFSLVGEWDLFQVSIGNVIMEPYLFGGMGVYNFDPQANDQGVWVDLQPLGTEGQGLEGYPDPYNLTQFNLPFGAGLKFAINETWTIGLEIGGRKLFTDYLDDVSETRVNFQDIFFEKGEQAARLSNPNLMGSEGEDVSYVRGNEPNDWYYISGISVSYRFGSHSFSGRGSGKDKLGCPTF